MNYKRIAFLILIVLSCLITYYLFGKGSFSQFRIEGLMNKEQIVDFKEDGTPTNPIVDEYGTPLIDGYYFVPYGTEKWTTGTKDYKKYNLKSVPYGYVATPDKKSIIAKTNVATLSNGVLDKANNLPEWRELTYVEYSTIPSKPIEKYVYSNVNNGKSFSPPNGHFKIKKADGRYEIAKIPINHALLDPSSANPDFTYLKYTGPHQDIPGYIYGNDGIINTGEFVKDAPGTIMAPGDGMYKIKLVMKYKANNTPKKVKYVISKIPAGFLLDSTDKTFTKLLTDLTTYDADNGVNAPTLHPDFTDTNTTTENGDVYYQFDKNGALVEIEYKDSNFAPVLYYMPGAYKFGSSAYVPNYEDSVYLSRMTREAQTMPGVDPNDLGAARVTNTSSQLGGFCNATKNNKIETEKKCNAIEAESCASTSCCVLLGGQKCVAGNESGPSMTANYSDYTLRNKDFYYYQGKCYGNCQ